jgi:hypothetical protein
VRHFEEEPSHLCQLKQKEHNFSISNKPQLIGNTMKRNWMARKYRKTAFPQTIDGYLNYIHRIIIAKKISKL